MKKTASDVIFKRVNHFNKQGNRPANVGPAVNLSPIRYHTTTKLRPTEIEQRIALAKEPPSQLYSSALRRNKSIISNS
jgi:hypothetical protein